MTMLALPPEECRQISVRARDLAQQFGPKRTGYGGRALQPTQIPGEVGIHVPGDAFYMLIQDQGMAPFIMRGLAGKTIPIRGRDGRIHFRRATAENIGRRKITSRDELGRIVSSKLTWRHPGLVPKNFIDRAIRQATREWYEQLTPARAVQILRASGALRELEA